jgi:hypothetical protein
MTYNIIAKKMKWDQVLQHYIKHYIYQDISTHITCLLMHLFQARNVCGYVFVCKGYRFCLFLRFLKLIFGNVSPVYVFRHFITSKGFSCCRTWSHFIFPFFKFVFPLYCVTACIDTVLVFPSVLYIYIKMSSDLGLLCFRLLKALVKMFFPTSNL